MTTTTATDPLPFPAAHVDGAGQLLQFLRSAQDSTISEIAAAMGLSRSTVILRLDALATAGLIQTQPGSNGARGRPAAVIRFNPDSAILLAAHVGITGCRLAATDLSGELLGSGFIDVNLSGGPAGLLADMATGFDAIIADLGRASAVVAGIGLGMPSAVELLSYSRSLGLAGADWNRERFRADISERYSAPVYVDLDVNMLALAERRIAWPDVEVFVCVKLGTLIDAAIVVNDLPIRGASDGAGGLGHIKVMGSTLPCTCGSIGCLDAVASGSALVRQLARSGFDVSHVSDVIRLVDQGHPEALLAVRDAGKRIGEALSTVVNLLNPAVISIWGYLTGAESVLFAGIREGLSQSALPRSSEELRLVVTALGESAGVRGAAMRVIDEVLKPAAIDRLVSTGSWLPPAS